MVCFVFIGRIISNGAELVNRKTEKMYLTETGGESRKMQGVGGRLWTTNLDNLGAWMGSPKCANYQFAAMKRAMMTASALQRRSTMDTHFDLWRTVCAGNRSQSASAKKLSRAPECAMDHYAAAMEITVRPHHDIRHAGCLWSPTIGAMQ